MISVLLPTKTRVDLFPQAYGSLIFQMTDCPEPYEIIVVNDNHPEDDPIGSTLDNLSVKYIYGPCQGSAAAFEIAANVAYGDKLLFINDDVVFYQSFINPMLESFKDNKIVGSKLLYENMTIQHAGMEFLPEQEWMSNHRFRWMPSDMPEANVPEVVPAVTFSLTLVDHNLWDDLNGFSEEYFGENYSDTDFCLRALEAGENIFYQPEAVAVHYESATRGHNMDVNLKTFNMYKENWVHSGKVQHLLQERGFVDGKVPAYQ